MPVPKLVRSGFLWCEGEGVSGTIPSVIEVAVPGVFWIFLVNLCGLQIVADGYFVLHQVSPGGPVCV